MTTYHVTPAGKSTNDGSTSNPWSLAHALAPNNEKLHPGDEVRLHGGRYPGKWTFRRSGTAEAPIVYRPANDGRVTLDGTDQKQGELNWNTVVLECRYVWLQGMEIMSSEPNRLTSVAGSAPEGIVHRGGAIGTRGYYEPNAGEGCKVINCIIHDTNGGPGNWTHNNDAEVYGCIIFNNGWHSTADGGHGHGLYFQNNGPPGKMVAENVFFGNGGDAYGLHFYGSGESKLEHGRFFGNVSIQSNLIGGNAPLSDLIFTDNFTFGSRTRIGWDMGADVKNVGSKVTGNYCVGGYRGLEVYKHSGATVAGNVVIGGLIVSPEPGNTVQNNVTEAPTRNAIFIRPNRYDSNRWHIIVYNWENKGSVQIQAPFEAGDEWVLIDAFNPLGLPVKTGNGPAITVPMTGLVAAQPGGNAPWKVAHPGPAFGTFILQRIGEGEIVPIPEPEPGPDPEPDPDPDEPPPVEPEPDQTDLRVFLSELRDSLDRYLEKTEGP